MSRAPSRRRTRRSFRKKKQAPKWIALSVVLLTLLALIASYFVTGYQRDLLYAKYPLRYKEKIIAWAQEYNLDPWHLAAVIRCESSFDEHALSNVGARGLMQIMPETGRWLAGKFDEEDEFTEDSLYDADTNLKYGCWYLRWLMDKFGGDLVTVSAAYHAGHKQVQSWLNSTAYSDDGLTLARIPFDSTNTYVGRITAACQHYQELYDFTPARDAA